MGHDPSCVCRQLYYGMVWNHSATTKPRACVSHTPYTLILRFVLPAGRVCGVATHAVGGNAGYGLLGEPTTGLHFADIALLLEVIGRLKGNSIVIIEHNLDVIKTTDYIVDLGLEGGDDGEELLLQVAPRKWRRLRGVTLGSI